MTKLTKTLTGILTAATIGLNGLANSASVSDMYKAKNIIRTYGTTVKFEDDNGEDFMVWYTITVDGYKITLDRTKPYNIEMIKEGKVGRTRIVDKDGDGKVDFALQIMIPGKNEAIARFVNLDLKKMQNVYDKIINDILSYRK